MSRFNNNINDDDDTHKMKIFPVKNCNRNYAERPNKHSPNKN